MRIVQLANFYGPGSGGIRTTLHHLGRGYIDAGHESVLMVPGDAYHETATPHGTVVTLPSRRVPRSGGYRVITDIDVVCSVLDHHAPDRLEVSDRLTLRGAGWWARAAGVPSLLWAHERVDGVLRAWLPGPWPTRLMADMWNRSTLDRFDTVVCSTGYAQQEFERIGAAGTVRVPLGVDLDMFAPHREDPCLREELLDGADVLLVLCSRLSREKAPGVAVDAVRELATRGVRSRLVVLGNGPLLPQLRSAAHDLPVTFLGFISEREQVARILASADVALAPGPIETFGLAALEALASGTPVVASRTSALSEIVTHTAGRLASPDPHSFADAVEELMLEPRLIRQRGARQRGSEFPWSTTVSEMLALHRVPTAAKAPGHASS